MDVPFVDERGQPGLVGQYFGKRPVVLVFVYYTCPVLCMQTLSSLASTLKALSQEPGRDFEIVTVSFNPHETPKDALEKKSELIKRTGKPQIAGGWHFLTGQEADIERLTHAAGFRYVWDKPSNQFAHPTGLIVLTPEGRISRYLFGIDYSPRDLRLAVLDASQKKIGSPVERALLYCYHYDLTTGRYTLAVTRIVQAAGAATVLCLAVMIIALNRKDHGR